jgi:anti-sigma B factor antagonist
MTSTFDLADGVGIVRGKGTLVVTDAEAFRQAFAQWFRDAACKRVVMDLSGVELLDSAGLSALAACAQLARDFGGDLVFAALQKRPRMVFEITRFHRVVEVFDTVDEALRASR